MTCLQARGGGFTLRMTGKPPRADEGQRGAGCGRAGRDTTLRDGQASYAPPITTPDYKVGRVAMGVSAADALCGLAADATGRLAGWWQS